MEYVSNEKKADEICKRHIFDSNHYDCCMEMGEWKDEEHERERQQWIDKVCEWVKDNAAYYAHWEWNGDTYEKEVVFDAEECVEALKQSMKGE